VSNAANAGEPAAPRPGLWRRLYQIAITPHMRSMLLLGFSAGLPFFLVFSSLSAWLRQAGIQRSTIGMLAWVGLAYTLKFLWSPIVDRMPLPLLTHWLGRRRSWLLLAQAGIAFGLIHLSWSDPATGVASIALWAVFTAFCSATQDIALDAWRIESAPVAEQGAMVSAYQIGYRIALTVASAGLFAIADLAGWRAAYGTMAALVGIGLITTLLSREPQVEVNRTSVLLEERVVIWLRERAHWPQWLQQAGAWFIGAVVLPLVDFFARYGVGLAVTILLFLGSYRLTDFTMGTMTNSFYVDRGYTLLQVAAVVKVYGVLASVTGIILAGIIITRFGLLRALILGSLLVMTSNLGFSTLARLAQPGLVELGIVNAFDNLAQAIHGTSLIVFLSSLTSVRYTATQYALFSSLYALPPKIIEGLSGFVAESLGYANFFIYTASLSIPALLLLAFLARRGLVTRKAADS
jgi:MFS transporter, PAT family, beta-lactamase induction signal transducer AmpG